MSDPAPVIAQTSAKEASPPTPETPQECVRTGKRTLPNPPEKGEPEPKPVLLPHLASKKLKWILRTDGAYGRPRQSEMVLNHYEDVVYVRVHDKTSDPNTTERYYLRISSLNKRKEDNNIILLPMNTQMPRALVRERQVVASEPDETGKHPITPEKYVYMGDLIENLVAYWKDLREQAKTKKKNLLPRQAAENPALYPMVDPGLGDPGVIEFNEGCGVWTDIIKPAYFYGVSEEDIDYAITQANLQEEIKHMKAFWRLLYYWDEECIARTTADQLQADPDGPFIPNVVLELNVYDPDADTE